MSKKDDVTEFVRKVFELYDANMYQFMYDFDPDTGKEREIPLFSGDDIDDETLSRISIQLGLTPAEILGMNFEAALKYWKKYEFFRLYRLYRDEWHLQSIYKGNPSIEDALLKAIFGNKAKIELNKRYNYKSVKQRMVQQLRNIDAVLPGTYHKYAKITKLKIDTEVFISFPQCGIMIRSFLEIVDTVKSLFFKGLKSDLSLDEINEYNFLVSWFYITDIVTPSVLITYISHDDVLKIANYMFATYPLLSKILCDKYDYIFIDEYQDTQCAVIEIFLNHIRVVAKNRLCVGFFGDKMQSIYETGVGNIQSYVANGEVCEVIKADNYRCAINVIGLLNRLRFDIQQQPAKMTAEGVIANKKGSATFIYSNNEFDLQSFKTSKFATGWNFENYKETRVLFLTHRLSAIRLGFAELLSAYSNNDRLIGNEPDRLAQHLLKIGGILFFYGKKDYANVIRELQCKIKNVSDKRQISESLSRLYENLEISIEELIEAFDKERFVRKDDRFNEFLENHADQIV